MAIRAMIGRVYRQGNGQAIYLGHGCYPDDASTMLRDHYSDEKPIDRLIRFGIHSAAGTHAGEFDHLLPRQRSALGELPTLHVRQRHRTVLSPLLRSGPEWLYARTPDGWLASGAMPGAPPESFHADTEALRDGDPEWREWLRRTREFQRPQPLHSLIDACRAQQPGSGEGSL